MPRSFLFISTTSGAERVSTALIAWLTRGSYNRYSKRGHEQVVLGLLCDGRNCPVGLELFAGNTQDTQTVVDKIQELRQEYGLSEVTFVGDRGMITQANAQKLKDVQGLHTISALTHAQMF